MSDLEDIRLSLDSIEVSLRRILGTSSEPSTSVTDFHAKVATFFPSVEYEKSVDPWSEEIEVESKIQPIWWDELDEEFELDDLHWLTRIQKYRLLSPDEVRVTMEAIEAGDAAGDGGSKRGRAGLAARHTSAYGGCPRG